MKYTPKPIAPAPAAKPSAKANTVKPKGTAHLKPSGEIRIIGGQYRRTKLTVPNHPGLRPTPDRVRETLFNWLGQDLTGWRCADVFAGTGVLGFEAASRGAADVLLCEQDAGLAAQLKAVQVRLKAGAVRIERGDGLGVLKRLDAGSMQLVMIDPPFDSNMFEPALRAAAQAITPTGLVYLEAPRVWLDEELQPLGLRVHRCAKAGAVHFHLLAKSALADEMATA
ncbi:MAG: 16S rRNA (guanine(966)-N(2))-methyltransferase RsmD [Polaromonas sp.]|nr:16S rRNA (guanine(966)-N(2))-methyltransferase RsmD [Polaromonas sp.]